MPAALESLTHARFLLSRWPWRSLAYALTAPAVAAVVLVLLVVPGLPWIALANRLDASFSTVVLLAASGAVLVTLTGPVLAAALATVERRRLRLVDHRPVLSGHRPPGGPGPIAWLRTRYTEAATWRELAYVLLLAVGAPVLYGAVVVVALFAAAAAASPLLLGAGPVSVGVAQVSTPSQAAVACVAGLVVLVALPYVWTLLAGVHAATARALLHATLRAELDSVSRSRTRLANAFDAERRRIERDLHDGAQQRLVGLTLQLGLARVDLPKDSPAGRSVAAAHDQAKQLMGELRELIHGIRPQVLADLGVAAAVAELGEQSSIPVTVRADLPHRPPPLVETTAYFVVAEALANVGKHSDAATATVALEQRGDLVSVTVSDDGSGGADPTRGTGLTGLHDRVSVAGGSLRLSSPVGGPTVLHVELPCG